MKIIENQQLPLSRKANRAELAEFFGIALNTVDDYVKQGMPFVRKPVGKDRDGREYIFDTLACVEWRTMKKYGLMDDDFDPEKLAPADRKNWMESELKRIAIQERKGGLIPSTEAKKVVRAVELIITGHLSAIPGELAKRLDLPPRC